MQKILSQILPTGCSAPPRRRHRRFTTHLALCGLASLAAGWIGSANAGEHFYDFNGAAGDPSKTGFTLFGANVPNAWQTNGGFTGADGDGFLEITPAANSETLGILFPLDYFTNADNSLTALPLKGFFLETDVRIGNAVGNQGRPADGFSISFASSLDPVAYWGKQGQFRGWAGGDSTTQALEPVSYNYATGQGTMDPAPCDAGNAENGTKTGVSVQFDTWQGNTIIDQNGQTTAGNDNVGWRVHFNGKMIERILSQPPTGPLAASPDPTGADVNGLAVCPPLAGNPTTDPYLQDPNCTAVVCADTNSIQTGPYYIDSDGVHNGSTSNLCWAHLSVELTTNTPHLLTVIYKGRPLVDHVEITNFAPYVGQLIMGGRTGGANENRDVDNVHIITYPSVQSIFNSISSSSVYLNDFSILLQNVGPAKVNAITSLTLDGVDIKAAATINIGDPNTTVTYKPAASFASGSSHTVVISWTDPVAGAQSQSVGFTTSPWVIVPASAAVASVDQNSKGFLVTPSQVAGGEPNRMYWADEQLMGLHGTNYIDFSILATQTNNEVTLGEGAVVDYANSGGAGQFNFNNSWADFGIPGGGLPNDNNAAASFTAYLYFPAPGIYVMGGNSDDGLRVTFAQNSHDLLGTQVPGLLGGEGGRGIGALQNTGALVITNAGYYGFRLLFENGGGGCGVEWYMTQTPSGGATNILINDTFNNPAAIVAYQYSPAAPPYVSYAEPPLDDNQVKPDVDLTWKLTDASTTVNSGSVTVSINGTAASPTISKSGAITTIVVPHTPGQPRPIGTNAVALSFKDSANNTYAYNYTFVVGGYTVLPTTISTPAANVDATQPGFKMKIWKVDQEGGNALPNRFHVAEQVLAGLWGPNVATSGGNFNITNVNFDINFNAGQTGNDDGHFPGDPGYPGLDGTGVAQHPVESFAVEYDTWVVFPSEGTYTLGFNSDDGFRTTPGFTQPANIGQLTVLTPGSIAGDKLAVWGSDRSDAVGSQPTTPVTGNLVLALDGTTNSTYDCAAITNAAALAGNIALIERGTCSFQSKVDAAAKAGAIAVIIGNNRPELSPGDGWFPIEMTGGPADNIPAVMIDRTNYFALTNAMASGTVTVRLNPIDDSMSLGEADYGKGSSDVFYNVYVAQAGAYPLRTVYWQGGGGGNSEWFSVAADGSYVLLNDMTNSASLKTFRSATVIQPNNPTISVGRSGSTITITYTGTLQSSSTVNGSYTAVPNATSPYTVPSTGGPVQFYRSH